MKIKTTCCQQIKYPLIKKYINIKNLSRVLAFGILLNNTPINSFAGVLSGDGRYETFNDSNITINNVLEQDEVDVKMEGDTLINILNYDKILWMDSNWSYNSNNKKGYMNLNDKTDTFKDIKFGTNKEIELNKEYTMFIDVTKNTMLKYDNKDNNYIAKIVLARDYGDDNVIYIDSLKTGTIKYVFRPTEIINSSPYISILPNAYGGEFEFKDFMIIEGNHIDKDIEFFEGIQSSFENSIVTQEMIDNGQEKAENLGKYKVEYKTQGKNLININNFKSTVDNGISYTQVDNSITANGISTSDFSSTDVNPVKLQDGKTYSFSYKSTNDSFCAYVYYIDDKGIKRYIRNGWSFTWSNLYSDFGWYVQTNGNNVELINDVISNIQLEEGSITTDYEPYKESLKTFYLNAPLLEGDTIEYINSKATHIRRYNKIIFDGSDDEGWFLNPDFSEYNSLISTDRALLNMPVSAHLISNNLKSKYYFNTSEDMSNCIYAGGRYFNVILEKGITLKEGLTWLKANPLVVVYELDNPVYEPIKADLSVNLYEGTTYISNNSNIPANMKITIDRTLNRAVEYTNLAKENPTIENISKARMWTNLLRESIRKDELQDSVDSITEITDMILERKSASANLDLYIKSENTLIMSLNTNSITFDDFSGLEDIEKNNAINISISSSLPYNLNAYLATEIQNGDKTNTMDLDVLSIKESSETNYNTFNSINDKVILKSNCASGNNKEHKIDLKLNGGIAHEKDVYKTTIKFEAEQN